MGKITKFSTVIILLWITFAISSRDIFAKGETLRRFAFVVGANDGGKGRSQLRFANKDAEAFIHVLNELGGVSVEDTVLVRDATRPTIAEGLTQLKKKLLDSKAQGERQEVLFYYSGHSDEDGLRLKHEVLPYLELKEMITALPVDAQLIVVDSCASGQLAMSKGGQRRAAFLMDESSKTRGHAIITSSSSDEAAQESSSIGGSIFTHYFLSGLRGAADVNDDRKVTLSEGYQYAYAETLSRTEKTLGGPQHPSYDFRLAGTGDLILTDLRESSAFLRFPSSSFGRYFVRNQTGELVAEINKPAGRFMELALESGTYEVGLDREKKYYAAEFTLAMSEAVNVENLRFTQVEGESNPTRGTEENSKEAAEVEMDKLYRKDTLEVDLLSVGYILNQKYVETILYGIGATYNFSEAWAIGAEIMFASNWDTSKRRCNETYYNDPFYEVSEGCGPASNLNGTNVANYGPNYVPVREINNMALANVLWSPIAQRKITLMNTTSYLDLFLEGGIGVANSTLYPERTTLNNGNPSHGAFDENMEVAKSEHIGARTDEASSYGEAGRPEPKKQSNGLLSVGFGGKIHFAKRFHIGLDLRNIALAYTTTGPENLILLSIGGGMQL
jgi:outer membrane beta-barrel protein